MEFVEIDDLYILCTKPPACVLFERENAKHSPFEDLEVNVVPVFPIERSIKIKNFSVRRKQVPTCSAFCLTDYKVQGMTLRAAILSLKNDPSVKGDNYRKFCSIYVQLSRLKTSEGLYLLQEIQMKDLNFYLHSNLDIEIERLYSLEEKTIVL